MIIAIVIVCLFLVMPSTALAVSPPDDTAVTPGAVVTEPARPDSAPAVPDQTFLSDMVYDLPLEWARAENAATYIGDTSAPGCSMTLPWRVLLRPDTNYYKGAVLYPDSTPARWGGGPCDSIRIRDACIGDSCWAENSGHSIMTHPGILHVPGGWPRQTGISHKCWLTGTPLGLSGCGTRSGCEENPNLFVSDDGINFTNRVGHGPGDTIANPLFHEGDFIIDTVFWYENPDSGPKEYCFYDTGNIVQADTFQINAAATHGSDPRLFIGPGDNLWLVFRMTYACLMAYDTSGTGNYAMYSKSMHKIFVSRSPDGLDWSPAVPITGLVHDFVCPVIVPDSGGTYALFMALPESHYGSRQAGGLYKFTAPRPDTLFTEVGLCRLGPGYDPYPIAFGDCDTTTLWHMGIKPFGPDQLVMVFNTNINTGCVGTPNNRYIGIAKSDDRGLTWTVREDPILTAGSGTWDSCLYAPDFYFENSSSFSDMILFYGAISSRANWHVGQTRVTFTKPAAEPPITTSSLDNGRVYTGDISAPPVFPFLPSGAGLDPVQNSAAPGYHPLYIRHVQ